MQDHRDDQCNARVRHVPIRVESRSNREDNQDGGRRPNDSYNHQTHHQNDQRDSQYYNQQHRPNNHNNHNSYSSQTLPNTSSININYKPSAPGRPYRSPSPNPTGDQNSSNQQSSTNNSNSNHEAPPQARNIKPVNSGNEPSSQDDQQAVSPPETIPLPPPPSHNQTSSDASANNQQQSSSSSATPSQMKRGEDSQAPGDSRKQPESSDAANAINLIRAEVFTLLTKDINVFDGISPQAKEFLKLDELLTRCLLKLDNIDSGGLPELRQQRKDVVGLIDKCTDILQRKVQLNSDMQELYSKFSQ